MKVLYYWRSILVKVSKGDSELSQNFLSQFPILTLSVFFPKFKYIFTLNSWSSKFRLQKCMYAKMLKAPEFRNQFIIPFLFQKQFIFKYLKPSPRCFLPVVKNVLFRDNMEQSILPPLSSCWLLICYWEIKSSKWRILISQAFYACWFISFILSHKSLFNNGVAYKPQIQTLKWEIQFSLV